MTLPRLSMAVIAAALLFTGCGLVTGSGDLVTESRDVADFDRVAVSDGIRVVMTVTPGADYSVSVRYDDNLVDKVTTRVDGSTLVVEFDGSVNVSVGGDRAVEIVLPELLSIDASGGATVKATGETQLYTIEASGGATVSAGELQAVDVDVDASGGATVRINASSSVTGDASGGATIRVRGNAPSVRIDTSGGATVDS